MRKLFLILALIGLTGKAMAQSSGPTRQGQATFNVVVTSDTCLGGVSISTSVGTDVVQSTSATGGYMAVYVENEDPSASLYCNESASVTTNGSGGPQGKEIPPTPAHSQHAYFSFYLPPACKFYCKSSGAAATTATVCRWH